MALNKGRLCVTQRRSMETSITGVPALRLGSCSCCLRVLWLLTATCVCSAQVQLPTVNLDDTNFEDALGGPGWLLQEFPEAYVAGELKDSHGKTIPGSNRVTAYSTITHVASRGNQPQAEAALAHVRSRGTTLVGSLPRKLRRSASGQASQIWGMLPSTTSSMPVI